MVLQAEGSLEQERKIRNELEKSKRKFESDLRAAVDNIADLEKDLNQSSETIRR